jgi:glutamine amidotransferase
MISLIDYGVGNINAFLNIFKQLGIAANKVSTAEEVKRASKLILPGVGAFDDAMQRLNDSGMRDALQQAVIVDNIPVIGICVGMQMLANRSDEGVMPGLGWINGEVKRFDPATINHITKFPHMGWNDVKPVRESPLFSGLETGARFYFLHSFYYQCAQEADVLATSAYGLQFASAINHNHIYGIQCHPEKSHHFGIQLLQNFANL